MHVLPRCFKLSGGYWAVRLESFTTRTWNFSHCRECIGAPPLSFCPSGILRKMLLGHCFFMVLSMYDSSRKMVSSTWISLASNLLTLRFKVSSCWRSGAVIISSISCNCASSAPVACTDAMMASTLWDFSSRRLLDKHNSETYSLILRSSYPLSETQLPPLPYFWPRWIISLPKDIFYKFNWEYNNSWVWSFLINWICKIILLGVYWESID